MREEEIENLHDRHHGHGRGPWGNHAWGHGHDRGRRGGPGGRGPFGGGGRGPWGGHPGGPFGPGHPWHGGDRMERGMLRYVILDALGDSPRHGYEIIKNVEERTGGRYSPSPGSLYPTLQYLEDLGFVRSDQEESRRVYQITEAGRAELAEHSDAVKGFWSRFQERSRSGPDQYELKFLEDSLTDLARTVLNALRGPAYTDKETIRRVRSELDRCQNQVRDILAHAAAVASDHPSEHQDDPQWGHGEVTL